jgi:hypothetical protein
MDGVIGQQSLQSLRTLLDIVKLSESSFAHAAIVLCDSAVPVDHLKVRMNHTDMGVLIEERYLHRKVFWQHEIIVVKNGNVFAARRAKSLVPVLDYSDVLIVPNIHNPVVRKRFDNQLSGVSRRIVTNNEFEAFERLSKDTVDGFR